MDDKKKNLILMIGGGLVLIIIIIIIFSSLGGKSYTKKLTYQELETKIKEVGEEYYKENESLLPKNDGDTRQISVDDLVKLELMKPIEDYLKDDNVKCTGKLTVKKDSGKYYYVPYLDCGKDYVTSELYKKIINDNEITTSGNGLYQINNEYVFRGEDINNYVSFAGKTWQIIKIDEENDIKLISDEFLDTTTWDDRYNSERNNTVGINNYSVSRIKTTLENIYKSDELFSEDDKKSIVSKDVCIDAIGEDDKVVNTNSCSKYEEKTNISLPDLRDFILSSIDSNCSKPTDDQCQNYNYMATTEDSKSWWTITGNKANTYQAFYVDSYGSIEVKNCINTTAVRPVIYISKDIMFSKGEGTKDNPYVVE